MYEFNVERGSVMFGFIIKSAVIYMSISIVMWGTVRYLQEVHKLRMKEQKFLFVNREFLTTFWKKGKS